MTSSTRKHFLLLPLPAYGHVIPLLELGKKLFLHHDVTFAVSTCLTEEIKKRELVSNDSSFPVISIPDGYGGFEGLNRDSWRATDTLVSPAVERLLKAVPFRQTVPEGNALGIIKPVDFVIGDNVLAKALAVCHDRGIPYFFFNTAAATMTLGALYVDENYPTMPETEDDILAFMELPPPGAPLPPMPELYKSTMVEINRTTSFVRGIVVNSVRELEEDVVEKIEQFPVMKGIPLLFVAPLMSKTEKISSANLEQQEKVRQWLDRKEILSVIYVSFGSIAVPVIEQIVEVALALLKNGQPFIWSLPHGEQRHLPEQIGANIKQQFDAEDNQFLILSWAPQKMILQHPATSVFLSHCGWNSTLESLAVGVPVVAWPMFADQKINAEWLVQRSTAKMIEGTGLKPKRTVPAEEIGSILQEVGKNGDSTDSSYRMAAQKWKSDLDMTTEDGGSSEVAFRTLIEFADNA